MARHYYNIEVVSGAFLEEDEIADIEEAIKRLVGVSTRVTTEYVDSEG